jgi:ABC-type amino acid transport substrate-binding protein
MFHVGISRTTRRHWGLRLCALAFTTAALGAWAEDLEDLPKIKAAGVLTVALYKDNAPYSDGDGDSRIGVDVALAQALAKALGVRLSVLSFQADENMGDDLRNMVWKGHYLGFGPADVMLHVPVDKYLIDNTPRTMIFAAYAREQLVLLHRLNILENIKDLDDLSGKRLVAEQGSGAASLIMGQRGGLLRSNVSLRATGLQAAQAVIEGKADAAYITRAQAESAVFRAKANKAEFGLTNLPLNGLAGSASRGWPIGMAIKSSNQRLGMALEDALDRLRETGELQAIFNDRGLTLVTP